MNVDNPSPRNPSSRSGEPPRPLRVGGYARVSTGEQADAGTQEAQLHELRERAGCEGWELVMFEEPGVSGETLEARPQMRRLLDDVSFDGQG